MTLSYLSVTADGVRRALLFEDPIFQLIEFGKLAYRICTESIYQEDMPAILQTFRQQSAKYEKLIENLQIALAGNAEFLNSLGKAR
jgi:hypothetical protein